MKTNVRSVLAAVVFATLTPACSAETDSKPASPPTPATPSTPSTPKAPTTVPATQPIKFETTDMTLKGKAFKMEVAQTPDQIQRGLMYRDSMPDDHGMLFVMEKPDTWNFWMQNTRIPLDIIFLDKDGRVLVIQPRRPFDETGMGPDTPALYVIELNLGMGAKLGLKRGDTVEIPKKYVKSATNPTDK